MVYLDASVALARIGGERIRPPEALWDERLISSRLLEYETWSRLEWRRLAGSHGPIAERLLERVSFIELVEPVVRGARRIGALRTLDALHLASMLWLREQGADVRLASYDGRLNDAAEGAWIGLYPL